MSGVFFTISFHVTCTHNVHITSAFHEPNTISSLYPFAFWYSTHTRMSAMTHWLHRREQLSRIPGELQQHRKWEQCGSWQETDLISDPYLKTPSLDLSGSFFKGWGKGGLTAKYTKKKKEKGVFELTSPEIQSHQKATRTRKAVTRNKAADSFREKRKENTGNQQGW